MNIRNGRKVALTDRDTINYSRKANDLLLDGIEEKNLFLPRLLTQVVTFSSFLVVVSVYMVRFDNL